MSVRCLLLRSKFFVPLLCILIWSSACLPQIAHAQTTTDESDSYIEEIVVTARFREETSQDVGVSMSVMNSEDLARMNAKTFQDLVNVTPGLENISRGPGRNLPVIRGTAAANSNLDLLPQTSLNTTSYDGVGLKLIRSKIPELPLFDLDRVEVLKGPQPTYSGEGAVGGSIRYFSKDPSLEALQTRLRIEGSDTTDSDDFNHVLDGSISLPVIEGKLGLRLTAFTEESAGFIDRMDIGDDGVNDYDNSGLQAVMLFKPAENVTWRLSGYVAEQEFDYRQSVTGDPDDLTSALPGNDTSTDETTFLANTIRWDLENFSLESITGYFKRDYQQDFLNVRLSFGTLPVFGLTDGVVRSDLELEDEVLSQEVRVTTNFDSSVNFVGGVLVTDSETNVTSQDITDSALHAAITGTDLFIGADVPTDGEQISVYGEFQFSFLEDRLRASAGARYFDQEYITDVDAPIAEVPIIGAAIGAPTLLFDEATLGTDELGGSVDEVLPRFQLEYDVSDNIMLHGSAAKGARSGLYNAASTIFLLGFTAADPEFEELLLFDSDTMWSYEIGMKSDLADGRVRLNLSAYYSDWEDMQVSRLVAGNPLVDNLGDAEISGFEWELTWSINDYFTFQTFGNIQEAEFDGPVELIGDGSGMPVVVAPSGTRIPQTAESSYTFRLEGFYPSIIDGGDLIGDILYSRVGDRLNALQAGALNQEVPALETVNVRIGLAKENWSVFLYANNVTNEIEPTFIQGFPSVGLTEQFVNTPRTVGLTFRHELGAN